MIIREAQIRDIKDLHAIRLSVKENVLINPAKVTPQDYEKYLTDLGKGWLCEVDGKIAGFAIVDLPEHNVWALFLSPEYQGKGLGTALHESMLRWYFNHYDQSLWLTTGAATKAEKFYRKLGWKETEKLENGEIRFELRKEDWELKKNKQ
jgi:GNAT superfamily N-acetyltransferase